MMGRCCLKHALYHMEKKIVLNNPFVLIVQCAVQLQLELYILFP